MRRSTFLAALLLAAVFAGGDAATVSCPWNNGTTWSFQQATPSVLPSPSYCNTTTLYVQFEYYTPELSGSTLTTTNGTGINPNPSVVVSPAPVDAAGNPVPGASCQFFIQNLGPSPAASVPPPPTSSFRTCGDISAANAVAAPNITVIESTNQTTPGACCQRCTNTQACRQWAFLSTNTSATAECRLYGSIGTFTAGNSSTVTAFVGNSAGWGTGFVSCVGIATVDVARVGLTLAGSYSQLCNATYTPPVAPPNANITITVPPAQDAPVAAVSSLTVPNVCAGATSITGTFNYSGSNIAGQTSFGVTLNGAACTPGAANITGNSAGQIVSYTCTVPAPGVAAGALNVSVTASYSGSQVGRCAGVKTAAVSNSGTATTAPTASFGAAPNSTTVCTGNTQIVTTFLYTSSAANTNFSATSIPGAICTANPPTITGSSTAQPVVVTCTRAAPGYPTGSATITLTGTYTGNAPCTGASTISQNATVTVAPAESGVSATAVTAAPVCAPAPIVRASFRFNATNVGTITYTATTTVAGVTCQAAPSTTAGTTGPVSALVEVSCSYPNGSALAAGAVPISFRADYAGQAPCAGNFATANSSVTVQPTPGVIVAPVNPSPAPVCYGATTIVQDFTVTAVNGAGPTSLSATLAGVFPCTVSPATVATSATVTVTCSNANGFPSGAHALVVSASAAGSSPCTGTYNSTGSTTVTVKQAPTLAITPVNVDEPLCAGDPSVVVTWNYAVSGTVGTPLVTATSVVANNGATCTLSAPAGNTSTGTVKALCTNLPTTDATLDITLTMTVTEVGCGTVTKNATATYTVACCLKGATAYAKNDDNNPNPAFCHRHQRPNNVQTRNCPFYYGWFNQGPTTSDPANIDSVSHVVALTDPTASCDGNTKVAGITAVCEGVLDPPTGPIPGRPFPSRGDHVLKVTVLGYKYSTVRTFVYAGCPRPRTGAIPLSNTTCANTALTWKPWNWNHYAPRTETVDDPAGRRALEFRIPISRTGGCTCANLYWTVIQVGDFKGVPCST